MNKRISLKLLLAVAFVGVLVSVYFAVANRPVTPVLPSPPLKVLAKKHNIELGNFAILTRIGEKPYSDILTQQFDFVLADNTPNWYFTDGGLRPSENSYNFKQMDEVMNYAKTHNMPVQAHHYLWGEEKWLPEWLKNGNYNKEQLTKLIDEHIETVGGRYKGKIREWTVVNEAFTRGRNVNGLRDWWGDHTGGKRYIDQAFITARKIDPNAKLILNDFNNEAVNSISDEMYEYIKRAKSRGVPIDGIGMQMHIDGRHPPTKDEVKGNMERFGKLGVEVYVTEFDVNMNDVKAEGDDKDKIQADIYYEMMRACIESKVCHSFAILGITDKESWYNYLGLPDARPLLFDDKYHPKPSFYSLRDALAE
jgi:endo-1,4-beta-xylanase